MENDRLLPLYAIGTAAAFGLALSLVNYATERPTFDQRWAPVRDLYHGGKGDRLDRRPPIGAHYNWGANPYLERFRLV